MQKMVLGLGLVMLSTGLFADEWSETDLTSSINPVKIRFGTSFHERTAINVVSFAYDTKAPKWLRANRLEFALGAVSRAEQSRPFISLGPVWRWEPEGSKKNWFVDFGLSPTVLGGAKFDGRDLGGNLHFTSSVEIARKFGRSGSSTVSLRLQHLSNGGLNDTNPGLDTIMLGFSYRPE